MKYIPILFSSLMVQALLAGRKTMTRRVIKPQPNISEGRYDGISDLDFKDTTEECHFLEYTENGKPIERYYNLGKCPYGKVGDVLWVRETFGKWVDDYYYKASTEIGDEVCKWKPNIHMPKEACRLFIEITNIRVERLQDISEEDAIAEGVERGTDHLNSLFVIPPVPSKVYSSGNISLIRTDYGNATDAFEGLWKSINGADSWNKNGCDWRSKSLALPLMLSTTLDGFYFANCVLSAALLSELILTI